MTAIGGAKVRGRDRTSFGAVAALALDLADVRLPFLPIPSIEA